MSPNIQNFGSNLTAKNILIIKSKKMTKSTFIISLRGRVTRLEVDFFSNCASLLLIALYEDDFFFRTWSISVKDVFITLTNSGNDILEGYFSAAHLNWHTQT